MKKQLKTAPQFLEHYAPYIEDYCWKYGLQISCVLKAMRLYTKYKSDIAYEKWFQSCLKQLWEKKN